MSLSQLGAVPGRPGGREPGCLLGIRTSSWLDRLSRGGSGRIRGPGHHHPGQGRAGALFHRRSLPASSPHGKLSDISWGMIYGITAFAGYEAATTLAKRPRTRRSIPRSITGVVIAVDLLSGCSRGGGLRRRARRHSGFVQQDSPVRYLAGRYWSPSFYWTIDLVVVSLVSALLSPASTWSSASCSPWARARPSECVGHAVQPPYAGGFDRERCSRSSPAGPAAHLRVRWRAHFCLSCRRGRTVARAHLPGREHRHHPRLPGRIP